MPRRYRVLYAGCLCIAALAVVAEHRVPDSALHTFRGAGGGGRGGGGKAVSIAPAGRTPNADDCAWIERQSRDKVRKAISLHRGGEEGADIVKALRDPDDPIHAIIWDAFRAAGVPAELVNESLADWTAGTDVLSIGRRWQEKGIDVRRAVREAERRCLQVGRFLRYKDTQ